MASTVIKDTRFVLFETRQMNVPVTQLVFTSGFESSNVGLKHHNFIYLTNESWIVSEKIQETNTNELNTISLLWKKQLKESISV